MNKEQKAERVAQIAEAIRGSEAVFGDGGIRLQLPAPPGLLGP